MIPQWLPAHVAFTTWLVWEMGSFLPGLEQHMTQMLIVQKLVPPFHPFAQVNHNQKAVLTIHKAKWGTQGLTDPHFSNWTSLLLAQFGLVFVCSNCSSLLLCRGSPVEYKGQSYTVGFGSALLWAKGCECPPSPLSYRKPRFPRKDTCVQAGRKLWYILVHPCWGNRGNQNFSTT